MNKRARVSDGFSRQYGALSSQFSEQVGEPKSHYGAASQNIREELVRCLWFGSHFSHDELRTDDGKRLEVISPGWWNVEGGPDFKRAEILMEGKGRMVGDVEIHTRAPGWYDHGHHKQSEYNSVCLHVVMWKAQNDRPVRRKDGQIIPQLTLYDFLDDEIDELIEIVDMEGGEDRSEIDGPSAGRYCGQALANGEMTPAWLGRFLDCAGDQRVISRAKHLAEKMDDNPPEEILYLRLADALGYKNNRMGFRQLASALPVATLQKIVPTDEPMNVRRSVLEAAYYGVGGFLREETRKYDDETAEYLRNLKDIWNRLPVELHEHRMGEAHWDYGGTRPVNFPPRRIAALAGIYANHLPDGLSGHLARSTRSVEPQGRRRLDTTIRDALTKKFTDVQHPYWDHRFSLGGKILSHSYALVGEERACAILVDVLVPFLVAKGRIESDQKLLSRIHKVWARLPRRHSNTVVSRMETVLFPDGSLAHDVLNSARRQQGLHQLYSDFCARPDGCESCIIYLAHHSGRDLKE